MSLTKLRIMTLLAAMAAPAEGLAVTPFFLSDTGDDEITVIFAVDAATGQLTPIVELSPAVGEVVALAAASDQVLYGISEFGEVLQFTVSPPAVTTLGTIGASFVTGLAYSGGQLYAVDEYADTLSVIQLAPVAVTRVDAVRLGSALGPVLDLEGGDVAEDGVGNWYLWTNATQALYRLDVTTAVATPVDVAAMGLGTKTGLAFDYERGNALIASARPLDALLTLDPLSGLPAAAVGLCLDCPTTYDHRFGDLASARCTDVDDDGFAPQGGPCGAFDCDDGDPLTSPAASERCNGADDDCSGTVDDEPAATATCPTTACTAAVQCVAGACVITPAVCTDGNPCTVDDCAPASGCVFAAVPNGQSCADADLCNGNEACQDGVCTPGLTPTCDDGNPCTLDSCSPAAGCQHPAVPGCCNTDQDCADQDACTLDERCVADACTSSPRDCDDGNPCTAAVCDPVFGCLAPPMPDGTSCSDDDPCTGDGQCAAGTCASGPPPTCDDLDPCTADSCVSGAGCQHAAIPGCCQTDAECGDGDACTVEEQCAADNMCASSPRNCNDGNPCTTDGCNPLSGCQHTPVPAGACDDGNPCSSGDVCVAGACLGVPMECSDGNLCNGLETCVGEAGVCGGPGTQQLCTPGNARRPDACAAELFVENPGNPGGALSASQVCPQGDPSCDRDTDPSTCRFEVAICLRVPDARLNPPCTPGDVIRYTLTRPSLSRDPLNAGALLAALDALPGTTLGGRGQRDVAFSPALASVRCTSRTPVTVSVGASMRLRWRATMANGARSNGSIRLTCAAP